MITFRIKNDMSFITFVFFYFHNDKSKTNLIKFDITSIVKL